MPRLTLIAAALVVSTAALAQQQMQEQSVGAPRRNAPTMSDTPPGAAPKPAAKTPQSGSIEVKKKKKKR